MPNRWPFWAWVIFILAMVTLWLPLFACWWPEWEG